MKPGEAERLEALRALQARFLTAIRAGEWIEAEALQAQRFTLMDALLCSPPVSDALACELSNLAGADRALLPQLETARATCAATLGQLRQARHALGAYDLAR